MNLVLFLRIGFFGSRISVEGVFDDLRTVAVQIFGGSSGEEKGVGKIV